MPFSSLTDPVDLARAFGALDAAWAIVKAEIADDDVERERIRLAYIVSAFALTSNSESDLVDRSVQRFREKPATP